MILLVLIEVVACAVITQADIAVVAQLDGKVDKAGQAAVRKLPDRLEDVEVPPEQMDWTARVERA